MDSPWGRKESDTTEGLSLSHSLGLSLVVANGGSSLVAVFMLLTVVASLVIEHGFSSCGAWA